MIKRFIWALTLLAVFSLRPEAQTSFPPTTPPKPRAAAPPGQAADVLQDAEGLLQKQQYAQAEEKLQAQMTSQAKNPQFWFDLGFAQSHQQKTQDAIQAYRKAVELAPDWFEANLNLGVDLARSGDSSAAVPVLKHSVELKPRSGGEKALGNAWLSLAKALEEGRTDLMGAAAAYDKAAELNPGDAGLSVRAGGLLERAGDLDAAESHYTKAALAGDTSGMAGLIDLLNRHQRYADAEVWLRKYLKQNPGDSSAVVLLGSTLVAEGKGGEAIALLQPLSTPTTFGINRRLAEMYVDEKQYAAAIPLLQQLLEKNPSDPSLHLRLGLALLHQLKYAEAEAELLKAIQLKPDLTEAYFELAYAAQQNKHYELSIRVLDARAKLQPETAGTYWLRATSYDNLRAFKPAAENYKLFLAASGGKSPDQEFQARHRLKAIEPQR
ncbi:MAG TPA: tetratricopeptide repeat protein [Candidatus Angelobacter sp.]